MAQIAEVIKYEGDNTTFIWKHPLEDFNSTTQLIVHESQEAIFFMNGQALDLFGPGRYTLETQNLPMLGNFLNRMTGDQTAFHCEVYFINKTEQMAIKWGLDSKVQYMEPQYNFPLSIGATGEMALSVADSRKLLVKLVGAECYLTQSRLVDYFRAILMTRVKTYIARTMREKAISIFEIDSHLTEFSETLRRVLTPDFAEYGISLAKFYVTAILRPEGDAQYEKFKRLYFEQYATLAEAKIQGQKEIILAQTDAQKIIIQSQALATKRRQEGYTIQEEEGFKVMRDVARNEGSGSEVRNAAMNVGIGYGVGGMMGNEMQNIANHTIGGLMDSVKNADTGYPETEENSAIPGMIKLKTEEGELSKEQANEMAAFKKRLEKLSMMKEAGLLSEEDFEKKRQQILSEI